MYVAIPQLHFTVPEGFRDRSFYELRRRDEELVQLSHLYLAPGMTPADVILDRRTRVLDGLPRLLPGVQIEETTRPVTIATREAELFAFRYATAAGHRHELLAVARTGEDERVEIQFRREGPSDELLPRAWLALLARVADANAPGGPVAHGWRRYGFGQWCVDAPSAFQPPHIFVFERPEERMRFRIEIARRRGMPPATSRAALFDADDRLIVRRGEESALGAGRERILRAERRRDGAGTEELVIREAWLPVRRAQLELVATAPVQHADALDAAWRWVTDSM